MSDPLPRCVCNWKNCRNYQKCWRESQHPTYDGVIKIKFVQGQPESEALKAAIDRVLCVAPQEWKQPKQQQSGSGNSAMAGPPMLRYVMARHHFTEKHVQKYLQDPKNYTFLKPFSIHGAHKYLHSVHPQETLGNHHNENMHNNNNPAECLYLQIPNVPKEVVKQEFHRAMDKMASRQRQAAQEAENRLLREQLEAMKGQLTFLHDMVHKLQEQHLAELQQQQQQKLSQPSIGGRSNAKHRYSLSTANNRRHVVPHEIQLAGDDTDDCDNDAYWNETTDGDDWTDEPESDASGIESEQTSGTFHAYSSHHNHRASVVMADDDRTVGTMAQSIVSTSKSVKTLPRELELEEDDSDAESLEEEAFDNRSHAAASRRGSYKSFVSSLSRQNKNGKSASSKHSRKFSGTTSHSSVGNASSEQGATYEVQAVVVTDPYGEKGSYTGSISSSTGMPNGYGRLEYDKPGRWYEGDWSHGRWTGHGQLSNGDGDYYEGGLKNDHKHGRGKMKFADGRTFEGEYRNGQMVQGKMTYQDGSTYSGSWVDGMRHGFGRCVFTDESVYEGEFKEGEFNGHGKMTWNDGGWYEGEWMGGEMHGTGAEVRSDGSLRHDGEWVKGQPIRSKK